jgi:hypothetical protein
MVMDRAVIGARRPLFTSVQGVLQRWLNSIVTALPPTSGLEWASAGRSVLSAGVLRVTRLLNARQRPHFRNDRIAHLGGADHRRALGLDVRGAQPLGQRGRDRLIDEVGVVEQGEGIA